MSSLPTNETKEPGHNKLWSVYPFPGNWSDSIRVNQLITRRVTPAVYDHPYVETSIVHMHSIHEISMYRRALDMAELKWLEYEGCAGEIA